VGTGRRCAAQLCRGRRFDRRRSARRGQGPSSHRRRDGAHLDRGASVRASLRPCGRGRHGRRICRSRPVHGPDCHRPAGRCTHARRALHRRCRLGRSSAANPQPEPPAARQLDRTGAGGADRPDASAELVPDSLLPPRVAERDCCEPAACPGPGAGPRQCSGCGRGERSAATPWPAGRRDRVCRRGHGADPGGRRAGHGWDQPFWRHQHCRPRHGSERSRHRGRGAQCRWTVRAAHGDGPVVGGRRPREGRRRQGDRRPAGSGHRPSGVPGLQRGLPRGPGSPPEPVARKRSEPGWAGPVRDAGGSVFASRRRGCAFSWGSRQRRCGRRAARSVLAGTQRVPHAV